VLDCVIDWRRAHPDASVLHAHLRLTARRNIRPVGAGGEKRSNRSRSPAIRAVAAALVTGKAGVEEFSESCVNDPRVVALRGKVAVRRDDSFATTAAAVEIVTADGKLHKLHQRAARGSDDNPMTDRDLEDKLREAAARAVPRNDIAALSDAIWTVEDCADIAKLTALTVSR